MSEVQNPVLLSINEAWSQPVRNKNHSDTAESCHCIFCLKTHLYTKAAVPRPAPSLPSHPADRWQLQPLPMIRSDPAHIPASVHTTGHTSASLQGIPSYTDAPPAASAHNLPVPDIVPPGVFALFSDNNAQSPWKNTTGIPYPAPVQTALSGKIFPLWHQTYDDPAFPQNGKQYTEVPPVPVPYISPDTIRHPSGNPAGTGHCGYIFGLSHLQTKWHIPCRKGTRRHIRLQSERSADLSSASGIQSRGPYAAA